MATNEHNDAPPCTIHTKSGATFHVKDVNAWRGQDLGIYANGTWGWNPEREQDVLIPYDELRYIEFDFAALDDFHDQRIRALPATQDDEQEAA